MRVITLEESECQVSALTRSAGRAGLDGRWDDAVTGWREVLGHPGASQARAAYAARLLAGGSAIAWPPGRNDACWCGSGRKYKKGCGPVPALPDDHE